MIVASHPPGSPVHVAFDGSLHALWVLRVCLRLAAWLEGPVVLVHVRDGLLADALLARRMAQALSDCRAAGVAVREVEVDGHGDVAGGVLSAVPRGGAGLLVCGTRAHPHHGGLLAGSIAARLLRAGHCHVLALRILTPGRLAPARRLLLPLRGAPGESRDLVPCLAPLLADAAELHLLRVMETAVRVLDHAPREALAALRRQGRAAVASAERELVAALQPDGVRVDAHVRLDPDWMHAAGVVARSYRCDLLLMAGSDHQLTEGPRGLPLERLLGAAPCDVGIYRGPR